MTSLTSELKVRIRKFDPDQHDQTDFSCGLDRIDNYLKLTAKKQHLEGITKVWVALPPTAPTIIGFYAINAHGLEFPGGFQLPSKLRRALGNRGELPAAYLSMIGVHEPLSGQGLGRVLLEDAVRRIEKVSEDLGLAVIVLDVLDDDGPEQTQKRENFYRRFGFTPFPSDPLRMFYLIRDRQLRQET